MVSELDDAIIKKYFNPSNGTTDLSLGQLNTIFNAKTYADLKQFQLGLNDGKDKPVKLSKTLKTMLSGFAVLKLFEHRHDIQTLQHFYEAINGIQSYTKKGLRRNVLEQRLIDPLIDGGFSYTLAKYVVTESFRLLPRVQEFELFTLQQAQSCLFESVKQTLLSPKQIQFILDKRSDSQDFHKFFPNVDEKLIQLLDPPKLFNLLELHEVGIFFDEMRDFAQTVKNGRVKAKIKIRDFVQQQKSMNDLLDVFKSYSELSQDPSLSPEDKANKLSQFLANKDDRLDANELYNVLLFEPHYINKHVFNEVAETINNNLDQKLGAGDTLSKEVLEKIIMAKDVSEFSEEELDINIPSQNAGLISTSIKAKAAQQLIENQLSQEYSIFELAKMKTEPFKKLLEKLNISPNCAEAICNNHYIHRWDEDKYKNRINDMSKSLLNDDILSQNLSRSKLKALLDSYGHLGRGRRDTSTHLNDIIDAELLSYFKNEEILTFDSFCQLENKYNQQTTLVKKLYENVKNNSSIERLYQLSKIVNVDSSTFSLSSTSEINTLNVKISDKKMALSDAIKDIASKYASKILTRKDGAIQQKVAWDIHQGIDRTIAEKAAFDYLFQKAESKILDALEGNFHDEEMSHLVESNEFLKQVFFDIKKLENQKNTVINAELKSHDQVKFNHIKELNVLTEKEVDVLSSFDSSEYIELQNLVVEQINIKIIDNALDDLADAIAKGNYEPSLIKNIMNAKSIGDIHDDFFTKITPEFMSIDEITALTTEHDLQLIKKMIIYQVQNHIFKELNKQVLTKEQLKIILSNRPRSLSEYKKHFPTIKQEWFELLEGEIIFNHASQTYAADFLDEKSNFDILVQRFINSNPSNQMLEELFLLTGDVKFVPSLYERYHLDESDAALSEAEAKQQERLADFLIDQVGCAPSSTHMFAHRTRKHIHQRLKFTISNKANEILLKRVDMLNRDDLQQILDASSIEALSDLACANSLFSLSDASISQEVKIRAKACLLEMDEILDEDVNIRHSSAMISDRLLESDMEALTDVDTTDDEFNADYSDTVNEEVFSNSRETPQSIGSIQTDRESPDESEDAFFMPVGSDSTKMSKMKEKLEELRMSEEPEDIASLPSAKQ